MKYLAITAVLCLILAGVSFAGNVTMTEVITGGNLTLTMPSSIQLSTTVLGAYGTASHDATQGNVTYTVEDSRGTGAGWNLGFQISQFTTGGTPQRTIATSKFSMQLVQSNITSVYGQAVDNTNGPKSLIQSSTAVANTEVKSITALADYGLGKYNAITGHTLTIGADVYAGTYTATITATLNNAP